MSSIYFGGSRNLSQVHAGLVAHVVSQACAQGHAVHVGCSAGADQYTINAGVPLAFGEFGNPFRVFAVGSAGGKGFWRLSALPAVRMAQAHSAGHLGGNKGSSVSVSWLAGGALSMPLKARLIKRSMAALAGCSQAVFFLAQAQSKGSLTVAANAAAQGAAVFVFCCGFSGPPAPLKGQSGLWVRGSISDRSCWAWHPAQKEMSL